MNNMRDQAAAISLDVAQLRAKREDIARYNRSLATLEHQRKKTQVMLKDEYRQQTNPATGKPYSEQGADDLARTDSRYAALQTAIADETLARDLALAETEALRLQVELELATLREFPEVAA